MESRSLLCCFSILILLQSPSISPQAELFESVPRGGPLAERKHEVYKNRPPLQAAPLYLLPLTSVRPRGWLGQQLRIQADGLTGHLDEVWSDVGPNSAWLGGTGEAWERGPYFLDGLVPLAYLLDDAKLKAKVQKWVDWTLTHQSEDGSIGPVANQDWWPRMIMLKALTQYQEATGDPRVIPVMQRYFAFQSRELPKRPLQDWGKYRWQDELVSILWLYNRTGDASLLALARALREQGYNWKQQFDEFTYIKKTDRSILNGRGSGLADPAMQTHGVNNAMALKMSPVWSIVSGLEVDRRAIYQQIKMLDTYHGIPNGMFSADEHIAGTDPSQGIELCAVVESMFSYELIAADLGDPAFADRLERVAFNALPGTFRDDMWAHQYDQQPNQIACTRRPRHWSTNGVDANLYGLTPEFGCCTANMHQGWPKLVASLWMATADGGLAAVAYAPSDVEASVAENVRVHITEDTEYPFRETVQLTVNPEKPARFPLTLRVPGWAAEATVAVDGAPIRDVRSGAYLVINREWKQHDRVEAKFPMPPRISRWENNSIAVERGPLIFSLKIGENWTKLDEGAPAPDWEVRPTSAWNYGLLVDAAHPATSIRVVESPIGQYPFSESAPAVELIIRARLVPEWQAVDGSAGPLPKSPVKSLSPEETVTLVPYGAAKLRITAFPEIVQQRESPIKHQ
jgi:glycosyl hydrolase family 127 (putative beta-L-arabinofuranosidase)/beta-L-arabinofuranosidase (glycosyl hydrolase family 127)